MTIDTTTEAVERLAARIDRYAEQRRAEALNWADGSALANEVLAHAETIAGDAATLRALAAERDAAVEKTNVAAKAYAFMGERAATAEAAIALLLDPNAVHVSMLRGAIAKPSVAQILHIYPEMQSERDAARAECVAMASQVQEANAQVARLRDAVGEAIRCIGDGCEDEAFIILRAALTEAPRHD
jgi:hypothetical protein